MSDFNEYQRWTRETAIYPADKSIEYCGLKLCSEAGEVAGKIGKWVRGDKQLQRDEVCKELGDVLWYVARLADDLEINLSDVAEMNRGKLMSRKHRGVIKGDGDER